MRKNNLLGILVILMLLIRFPAIAEAREVTIALPEHQVTINGQKIDSQSEMHPLLMYKGITYLPLTDEINEFVGLELKFYQLPWITEPGYDVWFVGLEDRTIERWPSHFRQPLNYLMDTAKILRNRIAVNTIAYDDFAVNSQLEYPLLSYQDIVYLPLTYQIVVNDLGWTYAYDDQMGLVIDSTDPIRPRWEDERIQIQSPSKGMDLYRYTYFTDGYLGYPQMTVGNGIWKVEYKQKGFPLQKVDITKTLSETIEEDISFNRQWNENEQCVKPDQEAWVDQGTAYIVCAYLDYKKGNVLVAIDLKTSKVQTVQYPLKEVNE